MIKHVFAMALLGIATMLNAAPEVQNATARQRYPWNGKVDITYTLTGDVTAGLSPDAVIVLSVTASNRVDGATYTAKASALSGDTGTAEGAHHVVWDLNAQGLEIKSDEVVFTVAYVERPSLYCVIDLSGGANATSYPVTYVASVPSGGWTDEYKTTKLVLRLIEPGICVMGISYQVTLTKPFYCGVFEVTQKQYELVTGSNPSYYNGDMRPVECVSWNTIRGNSSTYNWPGSANVAPNSFVGRLQARTGLAFDLPTEVQWEYACRAGTTSKYNNGGDTENDLRELGRYDGNRSDGMGGYTNAHTNVGSYQPNAWGLYDMHGNVWEWCLDWDGSLSSGVTDPVGSSSGSYRVVRGGSWSKDADYSTSSNRNYYNSYPSHGSASLGFRLARTLSNTEGERSPEAAAGAERADAVCAAEAAPVVIDSRMDMEPVLDSIVVAWDAAWIGGDANATVVIADNGTEVKRATGAGEFSHSFTGDWRHELTYTTYIGGMAQDEVYTATVFKNWRCNISDATAKQRYPWNGKVDITYTLTGDVTAGVTADRVVVLSVTASNRVDGATYTAEASALSGDTGTAEGAHHVVWDLNAQGLEIKSDEVVFTMAYVEKPSPYCVIDLSGGANAASYPISYLADVPSGGWSDEYKTTKLVLRLIESGTFMMNGSYQVTLTKPFYCGVFEVTQKQYVLVTGSNPCSATSYGKGDSYPVHYVSYNMIRGSSAGAGWPRSSTVDGSSFLGKLQARTGIDFDLPTEAQWEYACRAGTTTTYSYGNSADGNYMWYSVNSSSQSHVVGTKQPNAWGLYDMHGNVEEWCLDWCGSLSSGATDPVGTFSGLYRVQRGGNWGAIAGDCTSSNRIGLFRPSYEDSYLGFRLVRTLSSTEGERSPEAVAWAERADALCAAEAAPVAIDSPVAADLMADSITVTWDASWIGGDANAPVVIADNGTEVKRATGAGEFTHTLTGDGRHELTYTTYIGGVAQDEAYAASVYKNWAYEVVDGGAVIVATTHESGDVTIPAEIDGYPVTGIAGGAFNGCAGLTSVTIPDRVTNIGESAFARCARLTAVDIPTGVTSIGSGAFAACSNLTEVVIPQNVWDVGDGAFENCTNLRRVEAPRGLKGTLEANDAFAGCPADLEIAYVSAEISGVTAKQRCPWNGKVDITYTLTGDVTAGVPADRVVVLSVTASNRVDGATYTAEASALSGDTGTAEGAHHVVWDLNAQGLEINSDEVVFTVAYIVAYMKKTPSPLYCYCVIDLSGGADAASYPVSYLADVPSGGWSDEYKTTKLVLRLVKPGTFMMNGSCQVTLTKPFYCGVFEVTQKQYELVTGDKPSRFNNASYYATRPVEQVSYNMIRGFSAGAGWPGSSAVDGNSFLGKLQARTGLNFDLPTEAQWEYACRAGTTTDYNSGKNNTGSNCANMNEVGRYWYNGGSGYSKTCTTANGTAKVGSYEPNAWGLYDMHGNVWEWCLDWYGILSSGVTDPVGSFCGSYRVLRGGSWYNYADDCTSSNRLYEYPWNLYGSDGNGFRLARTLSNTEGERSPEAAAGAERADALCAAEAAPVLIDSRVGMEPVLDSIVVAWDAAWIGGDANATVVIADNGTEVKRATGAGEFTLLDIGRHELTYTTYIDGVAQGEVYTATVYKGWKYEVVDGGAVITETTQKTGDVTIPAEIDGYPVTGIEAVLAANAFTRMGFEFLGWATKPSGDVVYADGQSVRNLTTQPGATVALYGVWRLVSPMPQVGNDADVGVVMANAPATLKANVTNLSEYTAYRTWADGKVEESAAVSSVNGWLSFALDADKLIEKELTQDDVEVAAFEPAAAPGEFSLDVMLKDVEIGENADAERLKKVFGLEGAETLEPDGFRSENVTLEDSQPNGDGGARLIARPAKAGVKSFFLRVRLK